MSFRPSSTRIRARPRQFLCSSSTEQDYLDEHADSWQLESSDILDSWRVIRSEFVFDDPVAFAIVGRGRRRLRVVG